MDLKIRRASALWGFESSPSAKLPYHRDGISHSFLSHLDGPLTRIQQRSERLAKGAPAYPVTANVWRAIACNGARRPWQIWAIIYLTSHELFAILPLYLRQSNERSRLTRYPRKHIEESRTDIHPRSEEHTSELQSL